MESRLPRVLSKLKPPSVITSNLRPITASSSYASSHPSNNLLERNFNLAPPSNRLNGKRHASPEMQSTQFTTRPANIRRSRSCVDINPRKRLASSTLSLDVVPKKLVKQTSIQPIPPRKFVKTNAGPSTALKPLNALKPTMIKPSTVKPIAHRPAAAAATSTTTSRNTAAQATTAATKRIPAYDYKARFLDLQERHKVLKTKYDGIAEQSEQLSSLTEQYDESQCELFRLKDELKFAKNDIECKQKIITEKEVLLDSVTQHLKKKGEELVKVQNECATLSKENAELKPLVSESKALRAENEHLNVELQRMQELLFTSNMERKIMHNVVMDLRGNIRVFCRVRPPLDSEEGRSLCTMDYLDECSLEISANENGRRIKHDFSFDQVFHPNSSQNDIFELASPLIQSALDGYNVCIFAYGQTGSGKTYTMDGTKSNAGIIPRTVKLIFDNVQNYKRMGWTYAIKVTFLEIYNEVLFDLLSADVKDMEIRMVSAKNPTEIYVSNITEVTVDSEEYLLELMDIAKANRATASTVGNERSSRSHAVTRLELVGTHDQRNETSIGTINLVDLAGSESPKTSTRMEETKKINKSLSELTNVIMALLQRQEHVPYRNSKLTHLLMPCLGGNSKTVMFINIAPFHDCFTESVKSLRFAASVNSCKMNKAKKNKFLNPV